MFRVTEPGEYFRADGEGEEVVATKSGRYPWVSKDGARFWHDSGVFWLADAPHPHVFDLVSKAVDPGPVLSVSEKERERHRIMDIVLDEFKQMAWDFTAERPADVAARHYFERIRVRVNAE
jgi:hypothetical protein